MLKIGVSSCFFHADYQRPVFKGKALFYLVDDVSRWLLEAGVFPVLIPQITKTSGLSLERIVKQLHGLVLQGGSDVAPRSYGELALRPEWAGDYVRDQYELELVAEFRRQKKPVLGLCRGLQLLNVAYKGNLIQDIGEQIPGASQHRNWEIYDKNYHEIKFVKNSRLSKLYGCIEKATVNSVHHQAVKSLGRDLVAEAYSFPDGIVEAFRSQVDDYVVGVQWHPEFQKPEETKLLSTAPLIQEFIEAATMVSQRLHKKPSGIQKNQKKIITKTTKGSKK